MWLQRGPCRALPPVSTAGVPNGCPGGDGRLSPGCPRGCPTAAPVADGDRLCRRRRTGSRGRALRLYVNGRQGSGDAATLVLAAHQEMALVYGDAGATPQVPSSYDFPSGL